MKSLRLSVGIPTYNQAKYLEETINSLLNQEIEPFEIVVSDNHSTDETPEILNKFKGRIKVIRPPKHLNMIESWNFVVYNLHGEWFSLLSSDDVALTNYVRVLTDIINHYKNAILVRAGQEFIDGKGKVLNRHYMLTVHKKVVSPPETLLEQLEGPKVNFSAFAVRKKVWNKVGGFPRECSLSGDWGFWIKISLLGDFITSHKIVSKYRTNYRPNLQIERLLPSLSDEIFIYLALIPHVIKEFHSTKHINVEKRLVKAMHRRLSMRIALLSKMNLSEEDRKKVADLLSDWAKLARCEDLLIKLKEGFLVDHRIKNNRLILLMKKVYKHLLSL